MAGPLVSTAWLAERLGAPEVTVLDATWYLPTLARDAGAEYEEAHIPGAWFFDVDEIADAARGLPHMLPSAADFAARMGRMGIGDGTQVVVYDANGFCASARVWWTFRVFGHEEVSVLDGGLRKWRAEGRPLERRPPRPEERRLTARRNDLLVRDLEQMRANLAGGGEQVVDARSRGRFSGEEPEPRPGLRGGHIPNSVCLPHALLIEPADGTLLPPDALRRRFEEAGVDLARPIVTTCGSGVTAAILGLALARLGRPDAALYDGSWVEWGGRGGTPVER